MTNLAMLGYKMGYFHPKTEYFEHRRPRNGKKWLILVPKIAQTGRILRPRASPGLLDHDTRVWVLCTASYSSPDTPKVKFYPNVRQIGHIFYCG